MKPQLAGKLLFRCDVIQACRPFDVAMTFEKGALHVDEVGAVFARYKEDGGKYSPYIPVQANVVTTYDELPETAGFVYKATFCMGTPKRGAWEFWVRFDQEQHLTDEPLNNSDVHVGVRVKIGGKVLDLSMGKMLATDGPGLEVVRGGSPQDLVTTFVAEDHNGRSMDFGADDHRSIRPWLVTDIYQREACYRLALFFENCNPDTQQDQEYSLEFWKGDLTNPFKEQLPFQYVGIVHYTRTILPVLLFVDSTGHVHQEFVSECHNVIRFDRVDRGGISEQMEPDEAHDRPSIEAAYARFLGSWHDHTHPFYNSLGLFVEGGASGGDKPKLGPKPRYTAWYELYPSIETLQMDLVSTYWGLMRPFFFRDSKAADKGEWLSVERWPTLHGLAILSQGKTYNYTKPEDTPPSPVGPKVLHPINPVNGNTWNTDDAHAPDEFIDGAARTARHELGIFAVAQALWWDSNDNNAAVNNAQLSSGPLGRHATNAELRSRMWENVHRAAAWRLAPSNRQRDLMARLVQDVVIQLIAESPGRCEVPHGMEADKLYKHVLAYPHRTSLMQKRQSPNNCPEPGGYVYAFHHNGVDEERCASGQANFQIFGFINMIRRLWEMHVPWAELPLATFGQHAILWMDRARHGQDYFDCYVQPTAVLDPTRGDDRTKLAHCRWASLQEACKALHLDSDWENLPASLPLVKIGQSRVLGQRGHTKGFCRSIGMICDAAAPYIQSMPESLWCPEFIGLVTARGLEYVVDTCWADVYNELRTPLGLDAEWRIEVV